jgi:hypothetical protein
MSDSNDSSWPGLISDLNRTFGLIRDVFGYALPGAVFLAMGVIAHQAGYGGFSLAEVKDAIPFAIPAWLGFLGLLTACYAAGDVMAAMAYLPIGVIKWLQWWPQKRLLYPRDKSKAALEDWLQGPGNAAKYDRLKDHPTEVTGDLEEIRLHYPQFLNSLDRRETLALTSGSLCAAFFCGWFIFYCPKLHASTVFLIGSILLLVKFSTSMSHLRRVRRAVREADELARARIEPPKPAVDFSKTLQDLIKAATHALEK